MNAPSSRPVDLQAADMGPVAVEHRSLVPALVQRQLDPIHPDRLFTRNGRPMLTEAILMDDAAMALLLIAKGANPLLQWGSSAFMSPITNAINRQVHPQILDAMLQVDGVPQARKPDGSTLVHEAARIGSPMVLLALARRGSDVNLADHSGITPLLCAVKAGGNGGFEGLSVPLERAMIVRALLAMGAEPMTMGSITTSRNIRVAQDIMRAMREGRVLNAAITGQPEIARWVVSELGSRIDPDDLANARAKISRNQTELQEILGPFAQAVMARETVKRVRATTNGVAP